MKKISHSQMLLAIFALAVLFLPFAGHSDSLFRTDKENRYAWYLAKSVRSAETPVIVALAGSGAFADKDIYMWAFYAGKYGFALVDVEGDYPKLNSQEMNFEILQARIDLALKALAKKNKLKIDKKRIFICGTAAGGAAAIGLMLKYPGKYKAASIMGGALLTFGSGSMLTAAKDQSFFLFHGTRDKIIGLTYMENCRKRLEESGAHVEVYTHEKGNSVLPSHIYGKAVERLSILK